MLLNDWFCGAGGATQGAHAVPGIVPVLAANHDKQAIATHSANFPDVEHFRGDIRDIDVSRHPYAHIFWASPECTNWSQAKGRPVDFDQQPGLFGDPEIADDVARSRALMQDVVRYLEGMTIRQQPVMCGVVENVVDIRKWEHWAIWRSRIEKLGYRTRLIALNSMHVAGIRTPRAPQSRDRLYLAYWHEAIGCDPDWDRWLRPSAHCPSCDQDVTVLQWWKEPGTDMGRYRQQYVYRCPNTSCRGQVVEPYYVPAASAIDWSLPGQRIGDRKQSLKLKTLVRIEAGIRKYARDASGQPLHWNGPGKYAVALAEEDARSAAHVFYEMLDEQAGGPRRRRKGTLLPQATPGEIEEARRAAERLQNRASQMRSDACDQPVGIGTAVPMLVPAGGTWNDNGQPVTEAMRTRTTRENDGILVPPLLVPVEGREGKQAAAAQEHLRTQTARNETGLLIPPFIAELRGGGSDHRPVEQALATVTASGNHHGLVAPAVQMAAWAAVYGYDTGQLRNHHREALPTQTTIQGDGLLTGHGLPEVEDCYFRMLEPHEIHAAMAFVPDYIVLGNKRQKVRQLGNAVTPPVAEILVSALVECITGEPIAA